MQSSDNTVETIVDTMAAGSSIAFLLRNIGILLGVAFGAYVALTILFIFVQEGLL